jgi:hypothetical protein
VKNWKIHARHVKRASAAIVVPVVKAAVADAAKAVAIADRVVMAVVVVKAAATVVHVKSVQKAETTAGAIPIMFQHS